MWDTAIRKRLKRELIPGIMNGESGEHYIIFLKGIQTIIEQSRIAEKLPPNSVVAKKMIDLFGGLIQHLLKRNRRRTNVQPFPLHRKPKMCQHLVCVC